jgi:hypothetical protein
MEDSHSTQIVLHTQAISLRTVPVAEDSAEQTLPIKATHRRASEDSVPTAAAQPNTDKPNTVKLKPRTQAAKLVLVVAATEQNLPGN